MLTARKPWLWRQCDIAGWQFAAGERVKGQLLVEMVWHALTGESFEVWL
jgi:hypothetical protein